MRFLIIRESYQPQLISAMHSHGYTSSQPLNNTRNPLQSSQEKLLSSRVRSHARESTSWNKQAQLIMDATIQESSPSVERVFEGQPYHSFWEQVTLRSLAIAVVLATVFSLVTLRIYMTIGVVGALNMPANVLSFFSVKSLVSMLRRYGIAAAPFTRRSSRPASLPA